VLKSKNYAKKKEKNAFNLFGLQKEV
jgi:hypothetical protein